MKFSIACFKISTFKKISGGIARASKDKYPGGDAKAPWTTNKTEV
jgi:hypothetical protein